MSDSRKELKEAIETSATKSVAYFEHHLGTRVRDKVTGFEGIITGRMQHLYGCNTYHLVPRVDKDGKTQDSHWYDEGRLEFIDVGIDPVSVRTEEAGAGEIASMPSYGSGKSTT